MPERPDTNDYRALFLSPTPMMDMRAPTEFARGAFPSALSLPLMSDDERAQVGTCYKQQGQAAAIKLGHQLVSGELKAQRLAQWSDFARQHPQGYLYCFRGGLRSQTVQDWLREAGIDYPLVTGGYKAMRRFLLEELERSVASASFVLISGKTGTGKTRVISRLTQTVDLEGLANHRGSSFGQMPTPQPSQIDFENGISIALMRLLAKQPQQIFLEDEGRLIGCLSLPESLRKKMEVAPMAMVEQSLDDRIDVVIEDYVMDLGRRYLELYAEEGPRLHSEKLQDDLMKIRKRLGGLRYQQVSIMMADAFAQQWQDSDASCHRNWIRVLLEHYYDPMYEYQLSKRAGKQLFSGDRQAVTAWAQRASSVQAATELCRDLILVGGGHSHVLALRMLAMAPIEGLRITLVSPASHSPYSGMLPGLVAGHYTFEETHIDLARLCQWANVRFCEAEVTAIDPSSRRLSLAGRPPLSYDVVSIDIGSQPELDTVPGARDYATPVKPVAELWRRWQQLHSRINAHDTSGEYRIAVVGGGAGSVELALAMAHRLQGKRLKLELWCGGAEILQHYNAGARRAVMAALQREGIQLHLNARVVEVKERGLITADVRYAEFDELFWCTGASAAPWIAASGLATDEQGFLSVRDTLQALDHDNIFGAGDIATQVNHPRPKAGVYAVRQAPVLAHNLRAVLIEKPLKQHRPQTRFLSLISLGDKRATADRGFFSASGGWVWRWKDRIDRAFMARFEILPSNMLLKPRDSLSERDHSTPQPVCGGCGAKVGADALSGALAQLSRDYPQHCITGTDDTVAVPAPVGSPVLQSIDVLRQMVSDPWQMGRIAANHALSDLYACGVRPVSALAAVTLPYASSTLLQRELEQLLAGALYEFAAVDCQLNGGHSMQGSELSLGFTVNGIPMSADGRMLSKTGAAPGDQLILTKPLGTGVLFAGHMQLGADGRDTSAAVASMLQSNVAAAELAVSYGASACTDITGFGLLGHLLEMLGETGAAHLKLADIPLLGGAIEQVRAGVFSTMYAANVVAGEHFTESTDAVDDPRRQLLFDPQTSGGLLIAISSKRAQPLCEALHERGYFEAIIIGEVESRAMETSRAVRLD